MKGKFYGMGLLSALLPSLLLAAVNINTATEEELKSLPGVGPAKAKAIVEYRSRHGGFKTVDELKQVKGIGDGLLAKLKPEVTAEAAKVSRGGKKAVPVVK